MSITFQRINITYRRHEKVKPPVIHKSSLFSVIVIAVLTQIDFVFIYIVSSDSLEYFDFTPTLPVS